MNVNLQGYTFTKPSGMMHAYTVPSNFLKLEFTRRVRESSILSTFRDFDVTLTSGWRNTKSNLKHCFCRMLRAVLMLISTGILSIFSTKVLIRCITMSCLLGKWKLDVTLIYYCIQERILMQLIFIRTSCKCLKCTYDIDIR